MLDMQSAVATPPVTRREDYRPPEWLVPDITLDFQLDPARTLVRTRLTIARQGQHDAPLHLDGEGLNLLEIWVNGEQLKEGDWLLDDECLTLPIKCDEAIVETLVEISPEKNSQLMGLYASGGILCTQCEAEGFRRITFSRTGPMF